jgi:putative ABC transport system permease protein
MSMRSTFETLLQDLRYGVRRLRRQPGFSFVATLTLALGIGATTAIFSVANGLLLRPLPYPNPDRIAMIWMDNSRIGLREDWHSYPDYDDFRTQNTTFEQVAIFNSASRTLVGSDSSDPERVQGAHASPNLFNVLGVWPIKGRAFSEAENIPGANDVVVISHGLWTRRFGARDDVIESTVQLSGRAVRVLGVMPEGFAFPSKETEFWVPTAPSDQQKTSRSFWLQSVGRLKPGVTIEQAQADLSRIKAGIIQRVPSQIGYGVYVVDYLSQVVGRVRTAVLVLLGAVAFVLLIACTNVANLLLARASTRDREMALRAAIGAGRGRLIRQLVTESVLLGCIGGLAGVGLAWIGLRVLLANAPADLPRVTEMTLNGGVLAFAAGLSVLTGLVFGTLPALQVAAADLNRALREGGRSATGVGRAIRRGLVVLEVAAAVVLLVGAGLMIRSFQKLQSVDLGFKVDRVLTARVTLYGQRYSAADARVSFYQQMFDRLHAGQGVEAAGAVGTVMLTATPNSSNFSIDGRPDFAPEKRLEVPIDPVASDYFTTMGVPLLKGRLFDSSDTATGLPTVIINHTMARMFWPDDDPLGKRIKYGTLADGGPWLTIVGVVGDTRRTGFDSPVRPETYLPHAQNPAASLMVVMRGTQDAAQGETALRAAVRAVDPLIPISAVRPLSDVVGGLAAQRRLNTLLLTVFAIVAALLAAVGIYGVMAYSVAERTREIGVRMALGASSAGILRLVLFEGLALSVAGIVLGLGGALALGRLIATLLYDVQATDLPTLVAIGAIAFATALVASVVPAMRAVGLTATEALRAE